MTWNTYLTFIYGSFVLSYPFGTLPASAQVISDGSMSIPTEVRQSNQFFEIMGGTEAGINLFHSFSEFSLTNENTALFINNNPAIQNVISRVTGASASEIFGMISSGGTAPNFNLFLLNPNGIIFGPNASLDIKGSFVATTANGIQFGNQGSFSASNPNDPLMLTIQPSAFFFNQVRPNSIIYQANNQSVTGLEVPNDKTLLLLGGDVLINGGRLTAPNGRVELGGLGEIGTVLLNTNGDNLSLSFPDGIVRADVLITNTTDINTIDRGSGSITINAKNIELSGLSSVRAGIGSNKESMGNQSGNISLYATEAVNLNASFISNRIEDNASGNGGDILIEAGSLSLVAGSDIVAFSRGKGNSGNLILNIRNHVALMGIDDGFSSSMGTGILETGEGQNGNVTIQAGSLSLSDGALIRSSVLGGAKGNAGNILIQVNGSISLENTIRPDFNSEIRTIVEAGAIGNGGNIDIQAESLFLTGGSRLNAFVASGGQGNGGNIVVNISDSVNISGVGINGESSGFFASTQTEAKGRAGNIIVNTPVLRMTDGAVISTQTQNASDGGNININTNTFEARSGGQLLTITDSSGNAGSITVNARDNITLTGSDPTFNDRLEIDPTVVSNFGPNSGFFAQSDGTGKAGNVTIETGNINISEGAQVTVSSPEGQAGNLTINANNLSLNRGFITAETGQSGEEGANIILSISDLLRMENESLISATANGAADGGNIEINTSFLTVFPPTGPNGSDIIAKAQQGDGGRIAINAQGIFGIEENLATPGNRNNDLDASSEAGTSGEILLNRGLDPNRGLVELPEVVVDPDTLIAQNACKQGASSEFVVTGRGGLPPSLNSDLNSEATQVDLVEPAPMRTEEPKNEEVSHNLETSTIEKKTSIPAQGWVFNSKGEIVLVSYDPTLTGPQRLPNTVEKCPS